MKNDFLSAIAQLAAEKNLPRDVVFEAVEAALTSAYRRDGENAPNIYVRIDPNMGDVRAYRQMSVVDEVEEPAQEISVAEARRYKPDAQSGDVLDFEEKVPENAGRIAAQTAKQVVLQRLREAERDQVFDEYSGKEGEIVVGTVQRVEPRQAILELAKGTEASLPYNEQVRNEHLRAGQRVRVIILRVELQAKGPQIIVSRGVKSLLRRLLELEVPEIEHGTVEIKAIAREGGHRSKVAVHSRVASIDPIGAGVGMRSSRIQNIVNELGGERIDIIKWDADPGNFVSNALSPAQVLEVSVSEDAHRATVVVPDRMVSLAIGKEGQNARLAAKLTRWGIDILSQTASEAAQQPTSFDAYAPGEAPEVDVLAEAEEVAAAATAPELVEAAAEPEVEVAVAAEETLEPAARTDEEFSFAAAVESMPVPDREEREAEDYGEEDDEEYEVPSLIEMESRPTAIRFAEDVLPRRPEEVEDTAAAKKAAAAKRPKRAPRFVEQTEEELEEIDYSGRIH